MPDYETEFQPNINELRDYLAWRAINPGLTLIGYTQNNLSPDLAVATARLFWPKFKLAIESVENDSMDQNDEYDFAIFRHPFAHTHVGYFLTNAATNLSIENLAFIGEVLVHTWTCSLKAQFPNEKVTVKGEIDDGDYIIYYWLGEAKA